MNVDDFKRFHSRVFSTRSKSEPVPTEYQFTPRILKLYEEFESGAHGFSNTEPDQELLLATFVLAVRQVCLPNESLPSVPKFSRVILAVSRPTNAWVSETLKGYAHYIFRQQRGDAAGVHYVRKMFENLSIGSRILQLPKPERWVMFGYSNADPLPEWAKGRLINP